MPKVNPDDLASSLGKRIDQLLLSIGRFGSVPQFERRQIDRDIDRVATTDAGLSFLFRSQMASLDGQEAEAESHLLKAARIGFGDSQIAAIRLFNLANYGRASAALAHVRQHFRAGRADISNMVTAAIGVGAVTTVTRVVDETVSLGQLVAARTNASILLAREADRALAMAGRTEDELAAVLDVAGELLRERGLLWLDGQPHIIALRGDESEDSAPGVHYYFRIVATPLEAAEMTGEVGWHLVERELVLSGLSVAFVGASQADALSA